MASPMQELPESWLVQVKLHGLMRRGVLTLRFLMVDFNLPDYGRDRCLAASASPWRSVSFAFIDSDLSQALCGAWCMRARSLTCARFVTRVLSILPVR